MDNIIKYLVAQNIGYIKENENTLLLYRYFTEMYYGKPRAKGKEFYAKIILKENDIDVIDIDEMIYDEIYFEIDEENA